MSDLPMNLGPLAGKINKASPVPDAHLRQAEVTAIAVGSCTIKLAGSTVTIANVRSLIPVVVGDVVWVAQQGTSLLIVGHIDMGWLTPSLQNGWVNYDASAGFNSHAKYRKVGGIVHIKGLIKSGTVTANTTIFTLPAGFRPAESYHKAQASFAGPWAMRINGSGAAPVGGVEISSSPSKDWADISCSFIAEQ